MPLKKADIIGRRICHVYERFSSEDVDDEDIHYPVFDVYVVLDDGACLLFTIVDYESNAMPFELVPALPADASEVSIDPSRLDAPIAEIVYSHWPGAGLLLANHFGVRMDIGGMPTPGGVIRIGVGFFEASFDLGLFVWREEGPNDHHNGLLWSPE